MITFAIAYATLIAPQDPMAEYMKKMVPVGKPLPDFNLKLASSGSLTLKNAIKGKKATIVNFWFYG